ncbi:MAG: dihydrofolate reductase [Bacteroidaceae bacterium]|nr:dihydrofolate reductase [Bacteroidaceae bacterium]
MISIIVATALNGAIGFNNALLYRQSADMKRFKELTTGNTVVMGRKTFESLPKGALPNRRNIVLTRNTELKLEGAECFQDISQVLAHVSSQEQVFIIGGEQIYRQTIDIADRIYLTLIQDTPSAADAYFPNISPEIWQETERTFYPADEKNPKDMYFITLQKKR